MSGHTEYVNSSGLRIDGRRPKGTRRVRCDLGVLERSDGSAIFEAGNTRVLAVVVGPTGSAQRTQCRLGQSQHNVRVSTAAFATPERRVQRPGDRRALEAAATIQQCFLSQ